MIYVRRDVTIIPQDVLHAALQAQQELEKLPADERADYIRDHADVWRAFSKHLRRMSYKKCWYSESPEVQSFFDVDHFRPKLRARRSEKVTDRGYEWLAFRWENFRLSAQRSNRLNTNDDTGETDGKGDWFELMDSSPVACWGNRCESEERPVLLDPVNFTDVQLIEVLDDGRTGPSPFCVGSSDIRVNRSIRLYGLNLPEILSARRKVIREVRRLYDILLRSLAAGGAADPAIADALPIAEQIANLKATTHPRSPYSRAARAELFRLGVPQLCLTPEEIELDLDYDEID